MDTLRAAEILNFPRISEVSEELNKYQTYINTLNNVDNNIYNNPEDLIKTIQILKYMFKEIFECFKYSSRNLYLNTLDSMFLNSLIRSHNENKLNIIGLEVINSSDTMKYNATVAMPDFHIDIERLVNLLMTSTNFKTIISIFKGLCIIRINTLPRESKLFLYNLLRNDNKVYETV